MLSFNAALEFGQSRVLEAAYLWQQALYWYTHVQCNKMLPI